MIKLILNDWSEVDIWVDFSTSGESFYFEFYNYLLQHPPYELVDGDKLDLAQINWEQTFNHPENEQYRGIMYYFGEIRIPVSFSGMNIEYTKVTMPKYPVDQDLTFRGEQSGYIGSGNVQIINWFFYAKIGLRLIDVIGAHFLTGNVIKSLRYEDINSNPDIAKAAVAGLPQYYIDNNIYPIYAVQGLYFDYQFNDNPLVIFDCPEIIETGGVFEINGRNAANIDYIRINYASDVVVRNTKFIRNAGVPAKTRDGVRAGISINTCLYDLEGMNIGVEVENQPLALILGKQNMSNFGCELDTDFDEWKDFVIENNYTDLPPVKPKKRVAVILKQE